MKQIYSICCAFIAAASLASCEMKDEIWGANGESPTSGQLQLNLSNDAKVDETLKRAESTDNGIKPGVFDPEEVNVNNYTLEVTDDASGQIAQVGRMSELGANNGTLSLTLEEGNYTAKAYNYDGSNVTVSTRPWFMGSGNVQILPGKTTNASIECTLQNIEVTVSIGQSFADSFKDDYSVTVDNGDGAIQTFTAENVGTKYYFQVPDNKNALTVSIKATTKATGDTGEQEVQRTYTVTKPADAEGGTALAAGDAFVINLTEDGSTSSYIDFGMTVDFTFAEQEEIISIPAENITYTEGGGGDDDEPTPPVTSDAITFEGLPASYTNPNVTGEPVTVTFHVEKGIKNLFVEITSDSKDFNDLVSGMGLGEIFDVANPGNLEDILASLNLITAGESIIGKTEYVFDVSAFMGPLGLFQPLTSKFSIRVVDAEGNEKSGNLDITINQPNP